MHNIRKGIVQYTSDRLNRRCVCARILATGTLKIETAN
jgi:hypothetical protein